MASLWLRGTYTCSAERPAGHGQTAKPRCIPAIVRLKLSSQRYGGTHKPLWKSGVNAAELWTEVQSGSARRYYDRVASRLASGLMAM